MTVEQNLELLKNRLYEIELKLARIINGTTAVKVIREPVIVPVKNITMEQIYWAYKEQHMNVRQIVELSGGKYDEKQIIEKIKKAAYKDRV
ncbi:hypothetical protein [Eisenbergiella tayi]|uniref:hypothetical protein n=1 Tax=Eisenbergiella tayi TaxID=1432052 RepID=UPI000848CBE1|nr:hypothetical protein [Eisenbergiella tayi]ODR38504.1 hypothetical protein BEI60_08545 [Eisenbergiella tayi]